MKTWTLVFLLTAAIFLQDRVPFSYKGRSGQCTIGVFSGQVTPDGRPLLWKNRDIGNAVEKFCYFAPTIGISETTLAYIANVNSSDTGRAYMGVNAAGFAIMNSNSYNLGDSLADGIDDGRIMRLALEQCQTLSDFEQILEMTNLIGRRDGWNFGAFDAQGDCAIYECGNRYFVKYAAQDSFGEGDGYVLRATFGFAGNHDYDGFPRYKRATNLVQERLREGPVDEEFVLQKLARDLANPLADPYPLPYNGIQNGRPAGFIHAHEITINRDVTRAVVVIKGIRPGEDPLLTTMFGMIGPPALSVVFPMWVKSGCAPAALHDSTEVPMYREILRRNPRLYSLNNDPQYINSRYLVGKNGGGLFSYILPLESAVIDYAESLLTVWRENTPDSQAVANAQCQKADSIYENYRRIPLDFPDAPQEMPTTAALANYPNPFNANTTIQFSGFEASGVINVGIFNLLGQEVRHYELSSGNSVVWDGRDRNGQALASGVYLVKASDQKYSTSTKAILMK